MKGHHPLEAKALQMLEHAIDTGLAATADNLDVLRIGYDAAAIVTSMRASSLAYPGWSPEPATVDASLDVAALQLDVSAEADDVAAQLLDIGDRIAEATGVLIPQIDVSVDANLTNGWRLNLYGNEVASGEPLGTPKAMQDIESGIHRYLHELISREMVADMLDGARRAAPMVVQELVPNLLAVGQLRMVLQSLVRDYVSIRNMPLILNALADNAIYTKDPYALADHARAALGRSICHDHISSDDILRCIQLHPAAQRLIMHSIQLDETGQVLALDPGAARQLKAAISAALSAHSDHPAVVLASPKIRRHVQQLLRRDLPQAAVLSYSEIPDDVVTERVATIEIDESQIPDKPVANVDLGDITSLRW